MTSSLFTLLKPSNLGLLVLVVSSITSLSAQTKVEDLEIRNLIAQKFIINLRNFKSNDDEKMSPVLELPNPLKEMLSEYGFGGVILFSENINSSKQILELTYSIQKSAREGGHPPMFIAVDQEGGRVTRLPSHLTAPLAGNMAIGATYEESGDYYAAKTGEIIAQELLSVGFNVNFAPTVDVNVNPENPVINVRSFGEKPEVVSQLGTAQLRAMQESGLIATLKHFPGHGDTNVDSHIGMPKVNHTLDQIHSIDLMPFRDAIEKTPPGMIMIGHIQYPVLDSTEVITKNNTRIITPATMSQKIVTDLLRQDLGYKGVVVTDALDMGGITKHFTETEAVIESFRAGCDIALIPTNISSPKDIKCLDHIIDEVVNAVRSGRLNLEKMVSSVERIHLLKQKYLDVEAERLSEESFLHAANTWANRENRLTCLQLAKDSITIVKNDSGIPFSSKTKNIYLCMPDRKRIAAFKASLNRYSKGLNYTSFSSLGNSDIFDSEQLQKCDVLILGEISPKMSAYELNKLGFAPEEIKRSSHKLLREKQLELLKAAKELGKPTILLNLRSPYAANTFSEFSDLILATYASDILEREADEDLNNFSRKYESVVFDAVAQILSGEHTTTGQLPVTINLKNQH